MKKKQQGKKKNNTRVFGALAVVTFAVVLGLLFAGLSSSINGVKEAAISKEPEAILASAGVSEDRDVLMPVSYYDQRADECVDLYDADKSTALYQRQFEWESCGYYNKEMETGLVDYDLGDDHYPIFTAGELTPDRGLGDVKRWFTTVDGKSASYIGAIKLEYIASGANFYFVQDEFYPLDEAKFSEGDAVNEDGHNHLFTMGFAVPFTVLSSGDETFQIKADDDTFVFVGDKLAIDMGGVHDATVGKFVIQENGEVYAGVEEEELAFTGIRLEKGGSSMIRIFHADRDARDSVFNMSMSGMNISIVDTKMAQNGKGDSMQVAYDPTDPTYEAPLGRSVVKTPDNTKGYLVLLTIEGMMVVVFSVLMVVAVRVLIRKRQ